VSGSVTDAGQFAKRERCTLRQVNLTLSLAFLAPPLVKAAVKGRLPRSINIERLRDPHAEWSRQFEELGLGADQRALRFKPAKRCLGADSAATATKPARPGLL
jgi:site-specific DNA recombinase